MSASFIARRWMNCEQIVCLISDMRSKAKYWFNRSVSTLWNFLFLSSVKRSRGYMLSLFPVCSQQSMMQVVKAAAINSKNADWYLLLQIHLFSFFILKPPCLLLLLYHVMDYFELWGGRVMSQIEASWFKLICITTNWRILLLLWPTTKARKVYSVCKIFSRVWLAVLVNTSSQFWTDGEIACL